MSTIEVSTPLHVCVYLDYEYLLETGALFIAAQGMRAQAFASIKELEQLSQEDFAHAHWIAKVYAALNGKEQAFIWLERGLQTGSMRPFCESDPIWDPIREDPRFGVLLRRMVSS